MNRLIASILLVASLFSIFAGTATIEMRTHDDSVVGVQVMLPTDASLSDASQCPDCPVSNDSHTCHLGHSCHCAGLVSNVPFSYGIQVSFYIPTYEFALPSGLISGITRPPIFA